LFGVAVAASLSMAGGAQASTTIFTNLSASPPAFSTNFWELGIPVYYFGRARAMPFTAATTADLGSAALALVLAGASNTPVLVYLESDNGGQPASILATLTQVGTIPSAAPGLVTFDYNGATLELTAGTPYWLVAEAQTPEGFSVNPSADFWYISNSDTGTEADDTTGIPTGPWTMMSNEPLGAFQVDAPAAAPEPATIWLMGLALLAGAPIGRKCALAARP
jgi:hypothetical protein